MSSRPFLVPPAHHSPDSLPVVDSRLDVVDLDRVAAHIEAATKRGRLRGARDPIDYLVERNALVEVGTELYATAASILCFGRAPQKIFPRAVVDLGHWRGTDPVSSEALHLRRDIGGTLFDQLAYVEEYLWEHTQHGMTIPSKGFQRIEVHEYPQEVLRELCVNMLAHRDYANYMSASRVQMFRDRIEWISPGGLPEGVTIDNLLVAATPRNPVILQILYEAGYVEGFGQGIATVIRTLRDQDMADPIFEDAGAFFIVTVYGRAREAFDALRSQVNLSDRQEDIIHVLRQVGSDGAPISEILERLPNYAMRTIQRDIQILIAAGFLEASGAGRARRYRLNERI